MNVKTRVNKQTGKVEYKVKYILKDENGNRKDSETGWFPTFSEAHDTAERLKKEKSSGSYKKKQALMDTYYYENATRNGLII